MAQDTRKDPRAKVLTMTVRYKSATVDEFIEHHSHDVSRGGIYIKTPSPFLPGTLLKFEIRIADDKAMLQGVGRVVWKRDAAGAGPDKPAGMGVKFIKVDEASRNLIDRLIIQKGGGVSAYDAEMPPEAAVAAAVTAPPAAPRAAPSAPRNPGAAVRARSSGPGAGSPLRRGTMIGLGVDGLAEAAASAAASSPEAVSSTAPTKAPPRGADPMFPRTNSEADMPPPEERTVMKQAAELLEEALKGAGGSMDELGPAPSARAPAHVPTAEVSESTPAPLSVRTSTPELRRSAAAITTRESSGRIAVAQPSRVSAVSLASPPAAKKKGSGAKIALSLVLVAGAAAAAYVAWQNQAPPPPPPAALVTPEVPPPMPAPTVSAPIPVDTAAAPSASAAAPAPPASAASAPSAAVVEKIRPAPASAAPAALVTRPAKPAEPRPAAAPDKAEPDKTATPPALAPVKPPPVVAAPRPKPAAKPPSAPKPSDDNPY